MQDIPQTSIMKKLETTIGNKFLDLWKMSKPQSKSPSILGHTVLLLSKIWSQIFTLSITVYEMKRLLILIE